MLPDMSGIEICRKLKGDAATRDLPDRDGDGQGRRGRSRGRLRARRRRLRRQAVQPARAAVARATPCCAARRQPRPAGAAARSCSASLRVDRDAHRVWVDDDEITLTALELRLLSTLLERRGRVQSRAALLDDVWGMSGDVTTRTVDTHVKRLREKLGGAGRLHRDRARRRLPIHPRPRPRRGASARGVIGDDAEP